MSRTFDGHRVADDVFAFTGTEVNWVIIQEGTELTLVDAGWNGDIQDVERSVRALGRRPQDLRAVLLTHAHADHTGALNHLHDNYGVPLYMEAGEVPNALGQRRRDDQRYLIGMGDSAKSPMWRRSSRR